MCIAGDMERVYEIGPGGISRVYRQAVKLTVFILVFRAENSNTHRHLTEFTGLDMEMTFDSHYSQVIESLDLLLLHIFRGLQSQYRDEVFQHIHPYRVILMFCVQIEVVKKQFPHEALVYPEKTLRLKFHDGVKLLQEIGFKEDDGSEPSDYKDLSTKGEQRLGQLIKDKYNTDYYILGKSRTK
jgi:aspartyl/asparaginyl-tRNA synthetase